MKGLSVLKNIIWAFSIVICLAALVVGFFFSAFTKYELPDEGQVQMEEESPQMATGTLNKLEETADGGQSYLDSLTFLCDSTLIGIRDYGLLSGGTATNQVWGSPAGNIPVTDMADPRLRMPDGTEMSASDAVAANKPFILVISLGMDSLQRLERTEFEANYSSLVTTIQAKSPSTRIVLCGLTSITSAYSGADGLTVEMVNTAEGWIQNVCRATGVYYADVTDPIKDTSGTLLSDYAGVNNKALNTAGISKVLEYLRCHMVP